MDLAEALPLGELAAAFASLPVFPLFDTAYFIISVLYLKYEPGECGPGAGGAPVLPPARPFPGTGMVQLRHLSTEPGKPQRPVTRILRHNLGVYLKPD